MQSSIRSDAPRLPKPPSPFSDAVHISQEISVTSSRASSPRRRDSYQPLLPIYAAHTRKKCGSDPGSTIGLPYKWNSKPSARLSGQYARSSMQSVRHQNNDAEILEKNRDSMRALSEFLMSKEPPPNHFMSRHSSDDEESLGPIKRSALKILGRKKKTHQKPLRLMQLPDSAVSAKTSGGARYIAISIPIEHDRLHKPVEQHLPATRQYPHRAGERLERAPVTVLKPVVELRESSSSFLAGPRRNHGPYQSSSRVPRVVTTPPLDSTVQDSAITLQKYYDQLNQQQKLSAVRDPNRPQRRYIAVSPMEMVRQDIDPRHSGGTAYSTTSILTGPSGHSRVPSNSSSNGVTVVSSLKLDLPPRNSSIPKLPQTQNIEQTLEALNQIPNRGTLGVAERARSNQSSTTEKNHGHARKSSAVSNHTGIESIRTEATVGGISGGSTPSPPIVFTAETARKYSNAANGEGPQIVRSTTPRVSYGSAASVPRPRTAPPAQAEPSVPLSQFNQNPNMARRTVSQREGNVVDVRRSREERVRARKQRDMEQMRPKSSGHLSRELPKNILDPVTNTVDDAPLVQDIITPPKRNPRRKRNSQELNRLRNVNTITPIMVVACVLPSALPVISKQSPTPTPSMIATMDNPASSHSHSRSRSNGASKMDRTTNRSRVHRPPPTQLSVYSSSETEESEPSEDRGRIARMRASSLSLRSTMLETRRQERRVKRNITLREKDLDTRLQRIERDNTVLLRTLNGIANSFGEMRMLTGARDIEGGRRKKSRPVPDLTPVGEDEARRRKELEGMEPILRELQILAPRVSAESQRRHGLREGHFYEYDEFDEDDGESIL